MPEENNQPPADPSLSELEQNVAAALNGTQVQQQSAAPTIQQPVQTQPQTEVPPAQPLAQQQPQPVADPVQMQPVAESHVAAAPAEQSAPYAVPERGMLSNNPSPQAAPQPHVSPSQIKHKKRRKIGFLKPALISLAALFLVGGGATATYIGVILPNRPDNVVAIALSKLVAFDTLGLETDTTIEIQDKNNPENKGSFTIDFNADANDEIGYLDFGVRNININTEETSQDFSSLVGINVGTEMKLRNESENAYIKVRGLETLLDAGLELFSGFYGESDTEELRDGATKLINIIQADWIQIDVPEEQNTDDPLSEFSICVNEAGEQLDFERILGENYIENRFFVVKNDFGDVDINGESMKHYEMTFSRDQFRNFANSVLDVLESNEKVKECLQLLDNEQDFRAGLNEAVDELSDYDFDVWIDSGKNLRRMAFVYEDETVKVLITTNLNIREFRSFDFPNSFKTADELTSELEAEVDKLQDTLESSEDTGSSPVSSPQVQNPDTSDEQITNNSAKVMTLLSEYSANNNGTLPESTSSSEWSNFLFDYILDDEDLSRELVYISDEAPVIVGDVQYVYGGSCTDATTADAGGSSRDVALVTMLNDRSLSCIDNS